MVWYKKYGGGENSCPAYAKMYIYSEGVTYYREKKKDNILDAYNIFKYLEMWLLKNVKVLLEAQIEMLYKKGTSMYSVIVPPMSEISISSFTRAELLNIVDSLKLNSEKSKGKEERLIDYLGEKAYSKWKEKKTDLLNIEGWRSVSWGSLQIEKMENVSFEKRIYLIGPCIAISYDSVLEDTLVACLQSYTSEYRYEVVRVYLPRGLVCAVGEINNIPLKKNDIVIFIEDSIYCGLQDYCINIDLLDLFNRPRTETWFKDRCSVHVNSRANKAIAKEIFDKYLKAKLETIDDSQSDIYIQKGEILSEELQHPIIEWADGIKQYGSNIDVSGDKIGSIVMNSNPFTKGHLYLIETAAAQVDMLYIFVVQEDKSYFSFEDRFELVKAGTAHLNNVVVVPSGEHVLSYKTLPTYFEKETEKTATIDASYDLEIFARYIAPHLGITYRFVGEEPIDMVTKQYNEQMASIFPAFGIEFVEIPRKTTEGNNEVISASRVRRHIEAKEWDKIRELVPETTYRYILDKYC